MYGLRWSKSKWKIHYMSLNCWTRSLRQAMDWKMRANIKEILLNSQSLSMDFQISLKIMLQILLKPLLPRSATEEWSQWCSKYRRTENSKNWVRLILKVPVEEVEEEAWNQIRVRAVKEVWEVSRVTGVVEVESLRNLASLEVKVGEVLRDQAVEVLEKCVVETRSCHLFRDPILIKLHNRLSEVKIVPGIRHTLHIDHQNLEERNHLAQWDHRWVFSQQNVLHQCQEANSQSPKWKN